MSLVANLTKLDYVFKEAIKKNQVIEKEARAAKDPALFKSENRKNVTKALKTELDKITDETKNILINDVKSAHERLDKYYKTERAGSDSYHFLRAERINQAKTLEEGQAIYKRHLERMTADDRLKHRFAYDDALYELQARIEPHAGFMVEETINEYRSGVELAYIYDTKIALEIFNQFPTLEAAIKMQLQSVEEGSDPGHLNWAGIVNDIKNNAKRNIYGQPEAEGEAKQAKLQINPYDEAEEAAAVS